MHERKASDGLGISPTKPAGRGVNDQIKFTIPDAVGNVRTGFTDLSDDRRLQAGFA